MKDSIERLAKEEKELEEKMLGTPSEEETTETEAAEGEITEDIAPQESTESVTQSPEPVTDEISTLKRELDEMTKRYKNLRASRSQKLYEAKSQLSAALETINALQAQLNELRSKQPTVDPLQGVFTEEDQEILGEQTLDILKRATSKATEAATRPLQEELQKERERRGKELEAQAKREKAEAYEEFLGRIARAVPDWEDINYDPGFETFLNEVDEDGLRRKEHFSQAESYGNSAVIIRYMKEYKSRLEVKEEVEDPLKEKVNPEGTPAAPAPEDKRPELLRQADIDKAYDDYNRGKYKGRHSEWVALEAKIEKAVMEGRVVK